jgi:hypothetical protein
MPVVPVWLARRRRSLAESLASLAMAVGLAAGSLMTAATPAGAAVSTVGAPCGFHVGTPQPSGAAGSEGFVVPLYPADRNQTCTATVNASGTLVRSSGSYNNVSGNGASTTRTVTFSGTGLPVGLVWEWSPRCADPAAPGTFVATVDGQSAGIGVGAQSCFPDRGGHSSLGVVQVEPVDTFVVIGMAPTPTGHGYWTVTASGYVQARGDAATPALGGIYDHPMVGMAADPTGGYWLVGSDGGVFSYDGAVFHGSLGSVHLAAPIVGMAATPTGHGYWLVASDGGVFAFGDAVFRGSLGGIRLAAPIAGMAATPTGQGYWLVGSDGGVFAFGDAVFHGSLATGVHLSAPIVGIARTPTGQGYWLVGTNGEVFAVPDAADHGSAVLLHLDAPVYGIAAAPVTQGYWLVAGDGGIFNYGSAGFYGATPLPT